MLRVIARYGATRAFLSVAILIGATLLSPVDSRAAGASALKMCRGPVNQTCATVADCGGVVDPAGVGGVSCDAVTHKCTVQCATTFANTDTGNTLTNIAVAEDACVGPSSGSALSLNFVCSSNTSGGPGGPDPTVANSLMCFEATSCTGTSCSPNPLAPNSTPTGARSVSTTDRAASDGTLGGPDTMVCTVQEVINLPASGCAIPTQGVCTSGVCTAGRVGPPAAACARNSDCSVLNEVTDNNAMSGNVGGTAANSGAFGPATVLVNCCGDGTVNQAVETCDTNPHSTVPDVQTECPACTLATITT